MPLSRTPLCSDGCPEPGQTPNRRIWNAPHDLLDHPRARRWEFYTAMNAAAQVNVTLADVRFGAFASVEVVDLVTGRKRACFKLSRDRNRAQLSEGDDSPASWGGGGLELHTCAESGDRCLRVSWPRSLVFPAADVSLRFARPKGSALMACVTPFPPDPRGFFYEVKDPELRPSGHARVGDLAVELKSDDFAVLDWGRGVWPAKVFWRWAAGGGGHAGRRISLNLGDGFGDDSAGTENAVFVDGVMHPVGRLRWRYNLEQPLWLWHVESEDGRFAATLTPRVLEPVSLPLLIKSIRVCRVSGSYDGWLRTADGRVDFRGLGGFAEHVNIRW